LLLPARQNTWIFIRLLWNFDPLEIIKRYRLGFGARDFADMDRGQGTIFQNSQVRK
jgi:hypothetical protein